MSNVFRRFVITMAVVLSTVSALPYQAEAQSWRICNRDTEEAVVAIGWHIAGSFKFASQGWWVLKGCGGCASVLALKDTSNPDIAYMYVKNKQGQAVISGTTHLCLKSSDRFLFKGNDDCGGRGGQQVGFSRTNVDLRRDYTTRLTPPDGRRGC